MRQLKITSRVTNRETASFVQYLKNIADIDLLTPQEELELSQRSILGDRAAINELVSRNLRFVVSVAKQYATSAIPVEDLINEGNLGLIKAAERFDGKLGNRFISYAVSWIRKSILEYLNNTGKMIRLPANKVNDVSKLDKKMGELEQMMGRNVDVQELMSEFEGDFDLSNLDLLSVIGTYSIEGFDPIVTKTFVTQEMLKRGFIAGNALYASIEHTDQILDQYFSNLHSVFHEISKSGSTDELNKQLDDGPAQSGFQRLA